MSFEKFDILAVKVMGSNYHKRSIEYDMYASGETKILDQSFNVHAGVIDGLNTFQPFILQTSARNSFDVFNRKRRF